jgi:hypothetical protein
VPEISAKGDTMDLQYSIINQCLQLLKQSDLPTIKKLRVEIQLIQMKRLLLNDAIPTEVQSGSCSMEAFEELLTQMRRICAGSCDQSALPELLDQIGGLLNVLGGDHAH